MTAAEATSCTSPRTCDTGDPSHAPTGRPSLEPESDAHRQQHFVDVGRRLSGSAASREIHGSCRKTRVSETIDIARRDDYERLGITFCIGLRREAAVRSRVLTDNGFSVDSIMGKNDGLSKELLHIDAADQGPPSTLEGLCTPIGQRCFLEKVGTQLHGRKLGHHPLAALLPVEGCFHDKLLPKAAVPEEGAGVAG